MTNLTPGEALSKAVADTYAAALLAQTYHWNVKGPSFYGHHKLFEELYDDAFGAIDGLAERMLALGSTRPAGLPPWVLSRPCRLPIGISADAMIDDLIGAQEQTVRPRPRAMRRKQRPTRSPPACSRTGSRPMRSRPGCSGACAPEDRGSGRTTKI